MGGSNKTLPCGVLNSLEQFISEQPQVGIQMTKELLRQKNQRDRIELKSSK